MRDSSPAHTVHRKALLAAALAVAFLGATSAQAFADAKATFDPSSMSFSDVADGVASAAQTVSLSNPGDAPLTLTGGGVVTVPQFVVSNDTCALMGTLAPGATCTVDIAFNATGPEPVGGVLAFTTAIGSRSVLLARQRAEVLGRARHRELHRGRRSVERSDPGSPAERSEGHRAADGHRDHGHWPVRRRPDHLRPAGSRRAMHHQRHVQADRGGHVHRQADDVGQRPDPATSVDHAHGHGHGGRWRRPDDGHHRASRRSRRFSFSPKLLTLGRRGSFKFTLSADAVATVVIERRRPGRAVRYQRRATVNISGKAGANTKAYAASRRLPEGKYRAKITARNAAGASTTKTTTFTVRRKRS